MRKIPILRTFLKGDVLICHKIIKLVFIFNSTHKMSNFTAAKEVINNNDEISKKLFYEEIYKQKI